MRLVNEFESSRRSTKGVWQYDTRQREPRNDCSGKEMMRIGGQEMRDGATSALCCSCMASWPDTWLASCAATWGFICSARFGCAARADRFPCTMQSPVSPACVTPTPCITAVRCKDRPTHSLTAFFHCPQLNTNPSAHHTGRVYRMTRQLMIHVAVNAAPSAWTSVRT